MNYRGGKRAYSLTPRRNKIGKRLARRSYPSFTKSVVCNFSHQTITALCKRAHDEMNYLSSKPVNLFISKADDSVIRESSWEVLWLEFQQHLPTLISIFVGLIGDLPNHLSVF